MVGNMNDDRLTEEQNGFMNWLNSIINDIDSGNWYELSEFDLQLKNYFLKQNKLKICD